MPNHIQFSIHSLVMNFIRVGIHHVSSKPEMLRGGKRSECAVLKNNHSKDYLKLIFSFPITYTGLTM